MRPLGLTLMEKKIQIWLSYHNRSFDRLKSLGFKGFTDVAKQVNFSYCHVFLLGYNSINVVSLLPLILPMVNKSRYLKLLQVINNIDKGVH